MMVWFSLVVATIIALTGATASAQQSGPVVSEEFCTAAGELGLTLGWAEDQGCRSLWRRKIVEARERAIANRALALAEQQRLIIEGMQGASRAGPPPPVTVGRFLNENLAFGDVVVTSKGPRVFIGEAGQQATERDFVKLEDPRSPHRQRTGQFEGAKPR